jgi:hypothetical protein
VKCEVDTKTPGNILIETTEVTEPFTVIQKDECETTFLTITNVDTWSSQNCFQVGRGDIIINPFGIYDFFNVEAYTAHPYLWDYCPF